MKIPDKIKIGENEYKVSEKRYWFKSKTLGGQINYQLETLEIRKNGTKRMKEDCFFHEITHGLLKEMEFNYPKMTRFRNNENFVQELGLLLRKTFLDLLKQQEAKK